MQQTEFNKLHTQVPPVIHRLVYFRMFHEEPVLNVRIFREFEDADDHRIKIIHDGDEFISLGTYKLESVILPEE